MTVTNEADGPPPHGAKATERPAVGEWPLSEGPGGNGPCFCALRSGLSAPGPFHRRARCLRRIVARASPARGLPRLADWPCRVNSSVARFKFDGASVACAALWPPWPWTWQ